MGVSYGARSKAGTVYTYYRCTSRADASIENCARRDVRAEELERLVWSGVEEFATAPGRVLSKLQAATSARAVGAKVALDTDKLRAVKERERERVITWARQGRITEEELDAQLMQLRAELAALEGERARAESARVRAEAAREQLRDAEKFLNELSWRMDNLTLEEMAAIVRRAVPREVVKPRAAGRKVVAATYRFSRPVILGTGRLPKSPLRRRGSVRRPRRL